MIRNVISAAAALCFASGAYAATQTFEATVTNVQGDAALLSYLGINSGGQLTVRYSVDFSVSGHEEYYSLPTHEANQYHHEYQSIELIAPNTTVTGITPDLDISGDRSFAISRDGIQNGTLPATDLFGFISEPYNTGPSDYLALDLTALDYDHTKWSRGDPITAQLLNSFSNDVFGFSKRLNGQNYSIHSYSVTYTEVSSVPLPSSWLLSVVGLAAIGSFGRRRRTIVN